MDPRVRDAIGKRFVHGEPQKNQEFTVLVDSHPPFSIEEDHKIHLLSQVCGFNDSSIDRKKFCEFNNEVFWCSRVTFVPRHHYWFCLRPV